jgi:hypothetical protein
MLAELRIFFLFGGCSDTESTFTEATTVLLYQPRMMMDDDDCGALDGMTGQGKPKYSEKPRPSSTLSTTNPKWPGQPRWEGGD